jgi:hypothetical protein
MIAIFGIGNSALTPGMPIERAMVERPIATPSATPPATPSAQPIAMRESEAAR